MTDFASLSGPDPIETWFTEIIIGAELARPRTQQVAIGPSELGDPCDRALAYKAMGNLPVNYSDPLKANLGTAFHEFVMRALIASSPGRYLTEFPVEYRGVSGSVDIFDRWYGRLVDLKTTSKSKISRVRFKGVTQGHKVQVQTYAAGLIAAGENVRSATLLYVPTDGTLADVYAASLPIDVSVADAAIDRLEAIQNRVMDGEHPAEFEAFVTPLCGWCPAYRPNGPLTSRSCPGGTAEAGAEVASESSAQATG